MALNLLAGFQHMQEQGDQGRMRYADKLLGQAYTAAPDQRQSALAKLAGTDARLAIDADSAFTQRDNSQQDRRRQLLTDRAKIMHGMDDETLTAMWPTFRADLIANDPALASGLPEQFSAEQFRPVITQLAGGSSDVPMGFREKHMMALAAGYQPGTPEYQRAMRVTLGTEGRASSAGYGFDMVEDAYGNPRPQRRNPRDGSVEVFHAETSRWVPLGGAGAMPAGNPPPQAQPPAAGGTYAVRDPQAVKGDIEALVRVFGGQITSAYRDPATNLRVGGVPNSQHMEGTGFDVVFPSPASKQAAIAQARAMRYEAIDEGDHVHFELPPQTAQAGAGGVPSPNLGVGRSKEAEAAAIERAKLGVTLENAPAVADAEADAARKKKEAEAAAERNAGAPKAAQTARDTIATLRQALDHPGRKAATGASAWFNPNNFLPGNSAKDFNVLMAQIKGKAFLQAFETLKGGGQITQVEGDKATAAMGRLETAQSEAAFEEALNELMTIAQAALDRAEGRTTGGSGGAGKYQVGQVVPLPDGRRVRVTAIDPNNPDDPDVELVP